MACDGTIYFEDQAFDCQVTHDLIKPQLCICGNEVSGNLFMKVNGHIGGQLLLTAPKK